MLYIFCCGSNALWNFSQLRSIVFVLPFQAKVEKTLIEVSLPALLLFFQFSVILAMYSVYII